MLALRASTMALLPALGGNYCSITRHVEGMEDSMQFEATEGVTYGLQAVSIAMIGGWLRIDRR